MREATSKSANPRGNASDWGLPIPMDDGIVLRADVFRPVGNGNVR